MHGDRHGVISIPAAIATNIPAAAARVAALEGRVIEVADSPNPSLQELREAVQEAVQEDKFRR